MGRALGGSAPVAFTDRVIDSAPSVRYNLWQTCTHTEVARSAG